MVLGTVATCVALLAGASSAWAGVGFSLVPTVPQSVTLGETGVQSSLILTNASANGFGETGYTQDSMRIDTITFVPSCGSTAFGADCPAGSEDPGVLVPSPLTASGAAGTACAGRSFTIAAVGDAQAKYTVTIVGAALVLGPSAGTPATNQCIIDYTASVQQLPTIDSEPGADGVQTGQKGFVNGTDIGGSGVANNLNKTGGGVGTAGTTVMATPTIATVASANITLGAGNLSDQATVSGLVQPVTGVNAGTVEFRLYGPGDATCATVIFTSSNRPLTLNQNQTVGTAQSGTYPPVAAGSYRWRAFYSGDAGNAAISGPCNAANESTTVSSAPVTPPPPPAVTPPPPPPPPAAANQPSASTVCTPPPGPAPAGGELCARGTAAIRGRTGCQGTPFNVVVNGRQIERVVFTLDGKVVRTLTRPNSGTKYVLKISPRTLRRGVHRILARTTFRKQSGTRARTLRTTFSLCARRASSPAFTG
jgi:hypothetical protein